MAHVRIWRFEPSPGREREFAAAYASDGVWAQLFEQAGGFIGTELLAPVEPGGSWVTLDRWESRDAFERFQQAQGEDYRILDAATAPLCANETFIGAFDNSII